MVLPNGDGLENREAAWCLGWRRAVTRAELVDFLTGRGGHLLKPGDDPIQELIDERVREEGEEGVI